MEESPESTEAAETKYQSIISSCLETIKKAIPSKRDKKFSTDIQAAIGKFLLASRNRPFKSK